MTLPNPEIRRLSADGHFTGRPRESILTFAHERLALTSSLNNHFLGTELALSLLGNKRLAKLGSAEAVYGIDLGRPEFTLSTGYGVSFEVFFLETQRIFGLRPQLLPPLVQIKTDSRHHPENLLLGYELGQFSEKQQTTFIPVTQTQTRNGLLYFLPEGDTQEPKYSSVLLNQCIPISIDTQLLNQVELLKWLSLLNLMLCSSDSFGKLYGINRIKRKLLSTEVNNLRKKFRKNLHEFDPKLAELFSIRTNPNYIQEVLRTGHRKPEIKPETAIDIIGPQYPGSDYLRVFERQLTPEDPDSVDAMKLAGDIFLGNPLQIANSDLEKLRDFLDKQYCLYLLTGKNLSVIGSLKSMFLYRSWFYWSLNGRSPNRREEFEVLRVFPIGGGDGAVGSGGGSN